jgi:NagD protein
MRANVPRACKALARVRGFVFDVDGTLALTDGRNKAHRALPGAPELLARLRARGLPFVAFTNGSGQTPRDTAASLRAAGLDVRDDEAMTPASVAADYFTARAIRRVLVLGAEGVWRPLVESGLEVVRAPERADDADAVFVGWYPQFSLADLEAACHAVWAGARLYTASTAPFFATEGGRTVGVSGAIVAAIRSVTRKRATVLGKPAVYGLRAASRRFGVAPEALAVIGDDPTLEVAMARAGGAFAIAVQTGLAEAAAVAKLPPKRRPHLLVRSVADLLALYPSP